MGPCEAGEPEGRRQPQVYRDVESSRRTLPPDHSVASPRRRGLARAVAGGWVGRQGSLRSVGWVGWGRAGLGAEGLLQRSWREGRRRCSLGRQGGGRLRALSWPQAEGGEIRGVVCEQLGASEWHDEAIWKLALTKPGW